MLILRQVAWARESGLLEDNLRCTKNEAQLIQATLHELRELLSDTDKMKKRYKLDLRQKEIETKQTTSNGDEGNISTFSLASMISVEERAAITKRAEAIKKGTSLPKRLFWAACDKDHMREMVQAAHGFIDHLASHLEHEHQRQIQKKLETAMMNNIEIANRIDDLSSLMIALSADSQQSKSARSVAVDDLDDILKTKTLRLKLGLSDEVEGFEKTLTSIPGDTPINLDVTQLKRRGEDDTYKGPEMANWNGQSVYVEWKVVKDRRQIRKLKPRIQALCRLLRAAKSPGFRALKCLGLIEVVGHDVFGMVFAVPVHVSKGGRHYTLRTAFDFAPCRPSASSRHRLAVELCTTLLLVHTAGWVHKGIRSSNVLYFRQALPELPLAADKVVEEAWLMGYEYARFDNPEMMSELQSSETMVDMYRHPDLLGGEPCSFEKQHDIYALGLVLLEIGFWCPLAKILKGLGEFEQGTPNTVIFDIQDFLLGKTTLGRDFYILQQLRFYMGDIYAGVVQSCLEGEKFDDSIVVFKETVVEVLADLKA